MSDYDRAARAYALYVTLMRDRGVRISRPWSGLLQDEQDDWVTLLAGGQPYYLILPKEVAARIRQEVQGG